MGHGLQKVRTEFEGNKEKADRVFSCRCERCEKNRHGDWSDISKAGSRLGRSPKPGLPRTPTDAAKTPQQRSFDFAQDFGSRLPPSTPLRVTPAKRLSFTKNRPGSVNP